MFAAQGKISVDSLLGVLLGAALIVACGCVINNFIDRSIDRKMNRTEQRALVTGDITTKNALIYATALGLSGVVVLVFLTNWLTTLLGLIGLFAYVVVYGWAKRRTWHGTLIGTISGSIPPVAGYTAVTGSLGLGAFLVFLILTAWQMPHFYAIALFRLKDYKAAGIPVLPAVKGVEPTKRQIIAYLLVFTVAVCLPTLLGLATNAYGIVMLVVSLVWLYFGLKDLKSDNYIVWAKRHFKVSLYVLMIWTAVISIDSFFV